MTRARSAHVHKPLRGTRSTPPPLADEKPGGLGQILEEGGDPSKPPSGPRRASQGSLKVPNSPTSSASPSPQLTKKRRMAQSRRATRPKDMTEVDVGGAREGGSRGAGGEDQVRYSRRKYVRTQWNSPLLRGCPLLGGLLLSSVGRLSFSRGVLYRNCHCSSAGFQI